MSPVPQTAAHDVNAVVKADKIAVVAVDGVPVTEPYLYPGDPSGGLTLGVTVLADTLQNISVGTAGERHK